MAYIRQVRRKSGADAFNVIWTEGSRRPEFCRSFPTPELAGQFKAEMDEAWPRRKSGPSRYVNDTLADRIKRGAKIDENGCWRWQRSIGKEGYGFIAVREYSGAKPRSRLAHRVSYEQFVGPIPDGLQIDHLCRVRECVNPSHLEPVTGSVNVRRSPIHVSKTRRKKPPPTEKEPDRAA